MQRICYVYVMYMLRICYVYVMYMLCICYVYDGKVMSKLN